MRKLTGRSAITAAAALAALAHGGSVEGFRHRPPAYHVSNLPSLGGTASGGNSINNRGWVSGFSNLPGDATRHATLWRHGRVFDLGTLGGPNSNVAWPVKNNVGVLAGIAETAAADPLGEDWSCSAFFPSVTGHVCRGFVRQGGVMRALPTLGGNNGFATGANNRGQVVGWAENTVQDPTCVPPQVLQFRAVVWEPGRGRVRELPPLPGDTSTAATAVNDRGQVVGISGICDRAVGRFSAAHAVLWEDGRVRDIGGLGGVAWKTPMAINQRGDVVGFSNVSAEDGGAFRARAFLWTRDGGIRDLGTLPGDALSQGLGINERRQVVGMSCSAGFAVCRAFLWENGGMTDLNTRVQPGYGDQLVFANDVNDLGMITGGTLNQDGSASAFLAFPVHRRQSEGDASPAALAGSPRSAAVPLPEGLRQSLMQRVGLREADLATPR